MHFQKEKQEFLKRADKSRKGSIDAKIRPLVNNINKHSNFFTTSSCSGRIVIAQHHPSGKKHDLKWLWSTHNLVKSPKTRAKAILKLPLKGEVWLRYESAILHIAANSLDNAVNLLHKARDYGFRRGGIISVQKSRVTLELMSTERIEATVVQKNKLVIDELYLATLLGESNKRLKKTWKKIEKLAGLFSH